MRSGRSGARRDRGRAVTNHPIGVRPEWLRIATVDRVANAGSPVPPPPRPIELRDGDDQDWLLSVLFGIALVAVGVWLVTNLFESVTVLAVLVGISLIVGGIAEGVALGGAGEVGWLAWLAGGLLVIAGVVTLAWPDITFWALAVLAGGGLVVAGAFRALRALTHRDRPDWPAELAVGAVGVVIGLVVLAWPSATLVVLAVLFGLRAIATGLVAIGTGWQLHRLTT